MKYILTAGWEDGIADLTQRLVRELASGKSVLWLTSGGSNIPASIQVMSNISADLSKNLSIMPADERYGELDHADSNWGQLIKSGFEPASAKLLPVLQAGLSFEKTIEHYQQMAADAFDQNDIIIAQLGIGPDGHIAGILPDSPATLENHELATGYEAPPLSRMTITFPAFRRLTAAYTFAFGDTKHEALQTLHDSDIDLAKQPSQILKQVGENYVYNDQVGEHGQ